MPWRPLSPERESRRRSSGERQSDEEERREVDQVPLGDDDREGLREVRGLDGGVEAEHRERGDRAA